MKRNVYKTIARPAKLCHLETMPMRKSQKMEVAEEGRRQLHPVHQLKLVKGFSLYPEQLFSQQLKLCGAA